MQLSLRRSLGRSGLLVSPLALGAMTFGNTVWGSDEAVSASVFNAFVDAGGNFFDTADVYAGGRSEELLGRFIADRKLRDTTVLATKFGFRGGSGRKNVHTALEGSLRRLGTDHVDLYWMHVWDRVTPVEEMLETFVDLVRSGKIRYFGLSDVPAWYAVRMVTLAQAHGVPGPIALQLEYSLIERSLEREHLPAARELGLALTPWSPLAFGFLAGKYIRGADGKAVAPGSRADVSPMFQRFTDRSWRTLDALRALSKTLGKPMAQVALAWVFARPGVTSTLLGARTLDQLTDNLASIDLQLSPEDLAVLDQASALEPSSPYSIFSDEVSRGIFAGATVHGWS